MEDPDSYLASGAPDSLRDGIKLDLGELAGHACCSPGHVTLHLAHEHTTQAGVVDRRLQLADDHTVVGVGLRRPKPVHLLRDPEIDLTTRPRSGPPPPRVWGWPPPPQSRSPFPVTKKSICPPGRIFPVTGRPRAS